jgi:nickel/cobalt exporter
VSLADLVPVLEELHRAFHESLAGNLRALQEAGSAAAFVWLVGGGFLYGVLHAIGPGHGKVVVGAYMFANHRTLRQGVLIASLSSLLQAAVAIALVLTLFFALGLARSTTESTAAWLESASFAFLAVLGAMLVARGVKALRADAKTTGASRPGHPGNHDRSHCKSCGHAATAHQLRDIQSLRGLAAVVASVGLRPCSGALLLMFLSCVTGQIWAGIAATLAMGVGTCISVGAVAVAAVHSRKWLLSLVSVTEARLAAATGIASILGGAAIVASVAVLLVAAPPPIHSHSTGAFDVHVHKR